MKTVNSIPPTQYPEDEQLRAENEETSNAINESNDNSQLSTTTPPPQDKPDTDSEEEAPSPVARSSRKPKAAARRSSTRARTKPLKVRIMEQEEAMLDFITVSKSPAKSPAKSVSASSSFAEAPEAIVTPMATPRRKRGAASRLEAEAARESPAAKSPSVRKRKQAASETPVPATETTNADEPTDEPEIQHRAGRPRKRRATSTALSTPLKPQSSEPPTTPAQREPTPPAPPPPEPVVPGASSPPRSTRKTLPPPRSRRTPARTPARSSVRAETTSSAVKNTPTRSTRIRRSAIPVEPEPAAAVESVQVQVRVDESIIMDSQPELPPLPEPPLDLLPLPEPEPAKPHHQESDVLETHSDPVPEAEPEPEPEVEEVVDVAEEVAVVEEVKKDPMKELKRALEVLQQSLDMDSLDLREAEDAVFETYVKLRDKRRKRELA
ncbi:hypothetical protein DFH27DRAFT_230871 [Peziza echinospora]|nr:hypothetical protein DFH27DRAFT_230871 [Peziza echinospora]